MILPTVRVDGETVYIGDVAMDGYEAIRFIAKFAREVETAADKALFVKQTRKAAQRHAEFIDHERLTDVMEADWYRRIQLARQGGLPVVIRLEPGCEGLQLTSAKRLDQVGPGPALEFRVQSGRKWRPVLWENGKPTSEVGDHNYVAEWRVVE